MSESAVHFETVARAALLANLPNVDGFAPDLTGKEHGPSVAREEINIVNVVSI